MATYEGLWDCPNCKRVGNRGPDKHCGGCGLTRGPDIEFYLPEDAKEVTEASELEKAQKGPDWNCAYCQGDNPGDYKFCASCGAGQDGSKPREVKDILDKPEKPPEAEKKFDPTLILKGCLGCFGLFILLMLFLMWSNRDISTNLTVVNHSWKRSILIDEFRTVDETAWSDQVPSGARVTSRSREVHHVNHVQVGTETRTHTVNERVQTGTRKVKAGKRNKGNGYFEDIYKDEPVYKDVQRTVSEQVPVYRDEPVYGSKVSYRIDRWSTGPPATLQGQDMDPRWPDFRGDSSHREKGREEELLIHLKDKAGKTYPFRAPTELEWRNFKDGQSYPAVIAGGECKSLGGKR